MKIVKRSGTEVKFDVSKVYNAICAANKKVDDAHKISEEVISRCSKNVEAECKRKKRLLNVIVAR